MLEAEHLERLLDVHVFNVRDQYDDSTELVSTIYLYDWVEESRLPEGRTCIPFLWRSSEQRDWTISKFRSHLKILDTDVYVLVFQGWTSPYIDGEPWPTNPKDSPDRIEVVTLIAVSRTHRAGRIFAIERDDGRAVRALKRVADPGDYVGDLFELFEPAAGDQNARH